MRGKEEMKRNRLLALAMVALVTMTILAGCTGSKPDAQVTGDYPLTISDSYERPVIIQKQPERIVSLAPSNTEILFALGLGDKVIGVTENCNYPEEAKAIEKVGGFQGPNMEKIVAAKPDLILADSLSGKETVEQLAAAGLAVVAVRSDDLQHLFDNIELIGLATGTTARAAELVGDLKARLQAVAEQVQTIPEEQRLRVFYEVWHDQLMSCGPNTFLADIIRSAGGVSVMDDATTDWPLVSLETLIVKNPQVIILGHDGQSPADVIKRSAWKTMDGVKSKRVYALNPDIWNRPSPRVLDAVEELAEILYPSLFGK